MQQPQPQQPKQQPAAVPGERLSWEQIQQQQLQREQREAQAAQAAQAAHAAHAQREAQVAREQREAVREVEQRLGCGEVWQLMCSHSIRVWKMFMMFVFVGFQGGVYNMNYSKYNYRK